MSLPLHLTKRLTTRPTSPPETTAAIVSYNVHPSPADWLRLHGEIFLSGVDRWTAARFQREVTARDWFSPQQMWWAIHPSRPQASGVVTLEVGGEQGRIHWLMVDAAVRRQGVASALLCALEQAAWDAGVHQLSAETLASWRPAVTFYGRHGYETA
ncbi:GNAT family N-acetyltransferase [Blastopirellula sp. J2-11]|uniref:GNAT family N-acetyltransferase n=1 Tax=Blastopirellula sp. J2-11 TaxID=2943192 RepID=UPI0021C6E369|nr:GNAT family N-acetyltransferase [Blastopirellula sp. J2-11]UUO05215.1 GNAT family N-acetyltransferase [Blastopirellula sp. J2-11]